MSATVGIVNSWNEWDPLREVILGTLEGKVLTCDEPAVRRKKENHDIFKYDIQPAGKDNFAEAGKASEEYGVSLKAEGISIFRPDNLPWNQEVKTPVFDVNASSGATCPRDIFFIAGNHIIEAPMSWRCRYFESYAYRNIMTKYYESDPRVRWSCAPKPVLSDASFAPAPAKTITNDEILFDAADCRRFGKDIFMQDAHTANKRGFEWCKRTLAADGIRLHEFKFEHSTFSHIDAKITPVDEDTLLWTAAERPSKEMFALFKENEWKMIECPARQRCTSTADQTGPGIHLNMLVIAPSRVMMDSSEKALAKVLDAEGIDYVPVDMASCYAYGGGLNCWTLDMVRDGHMKSYFPTLDVAAERAEGYSASKRKTSCCLMESHAAKKSNQNHAPSDDARMAS